ncbi:unnamed protein product [Linum trigynum]|uniref:SURF1-like protein n=1 Tax=Linum trigynum TaxID=586398 RepID=A0AAV2DAJ8_9ROSI
MAMGTASISKTLTNAFILRGSRRIISSSSPSSSSRYSTASAAVLDLPPPVEPNPSPRPQEQPRSGSSWSRWLLFLPGTITFGLGTWQIFRREEKIKVLEHRQRRLALEPMKLNDPSPSEQLDALEFRRVSCKGVFDEDRSIFVGPRSRSISGVTENGFYVVTPLMPIPGDPTSVKSPILVNRGWVPRIWKERSLEASLNTTKQLPDVSAVPKTQESQRGSRWWRFWSKKPQASEVQPPSMDPVEVIGVVRGSENPSIFVPENDPSSGQWFYVDIPAIAATCGLPENDIIYVEDVHENVNPSCPYPLPKDVTALISSSVMPQDHLNYSFTWYTLSAAVTFMTFKRLKQR